MFRVMTLAVAIFCSLASPSVADKITYQSITRLFAQPHLGYTPPMPSTIAALKASSRTVYTVSTVPSLGDGSPRSTWQSVRINAKAGITSKSVKVYPSCALAGRQSDVFITTIAGEHNGSVVVAYAAQCQSQDASYWTTDVSFILWNPTTGVIVNKRLTGAKDVQSPSLSATIRGSRLHYSANLESVYGGMPGSRYYGFFDLVSNTSVITPMLRQYNTGTSDVRFGFVGQRTLVFYPLNSLSALKVYDGAGKLLLSKSSIKPSCKLPAGVNFAVSTTNFVHDIVSQESTSTSVLFTQSITAATDPSGNDAWVRVVLEMFNLDGVSLGCKVLVEKVVPDPKINHEYIYLTQGRFSVAVSNRRIQILLVEKFRPVVGLKSGLIDEWRFLEFSSNGTFFRNVLGKASTSGFFGNNQLIGGLHTFPTVTPAVQAAGFSSDQNLDTMNQMDFTIQAGTP